ncbi:MAG: molybdopterin molybdotransferase MoeA [Paracoccaceae bacterium]|nr:molybdopterin molybdotransferase MoeA [Paracoccaceae bacterium]
MIRVQEALEKILSLLTPLEHEVVPLRQAAGRVLARPVAARRTQPPFAASSMDGYAMHGAEVAPGARFTVIGESAAGDRFNGEVGPGQCVRIFTGAPVPTGADRVVMQEDVTRNGDVITISENVSAGPFIRPAGDDFSAGTEITPPRRLSSADVALLAAMNIAEVPVYRRPIVALVATGDELVMPGEEPGPDQIVSSNNFGLAALIETHGGEARMLPIGRDNAESLKQVFRLCEGADLILTLGGASVGDHDIVQDVAREMGLETAFYKVAMRPGKPLMAGRMNGTPMIGLPGNPVSSMVCGHIFIVPALRHMQGLPGKARKRLHMPLATDLPANGPREHYMRARMIRRDGALVVEAHPRQDSALLSVLAASDALIVRAPHDRARKAGEMVEIIHL